ncbi:hypothetical protein KXR64_16760 [Brucella intermedia]|uniref:hypothetical protein n=1 Tax=Brucella TaxID=234 RepID=UPI0011150EF1|nr:hypothetical protein [Brucella intermedia]
MTKLKISKTQEQADEPDHEVPVDESVAEAVAEEVAAEPEATPAVQAEEYGKGGTYRSIGGGKRVRV